MDEWLTGLSTFVSHKQEASSSAALRASSSSTENSDAAETVMLPTSRAACSVGWSRVHNVPDVVSRAADFERLKVASARDVADIAIGPKIDENRQRPCRTE
jgi:hypothetical protein